MIGKYFVFFLLEILPIETHINFAGPILVEQLFHIITSKFPQEQWFSMFKTSNDLSTFLKLFSDCFHIQTNLVTLLQRPKLSDSYIQQAQARTKDQANNNYARRNVATGVSTAGLSTSRPNASNNNSAAANPAIIGDFKLNEPVSNIAANNNNVNNAIITSKSEPNSGFDSYTGVPCESFYETKLENLCENNCPRPSSSASSYSSSPTSNTSPVSSPISTNTDRIAAKNQSLKQRINNLVVKTLAENFEKDKHTMNAFQQQQQQHLSNAASATMSNDSRVSPSTTAASTNMTNNFNLFVGDTAKIKILQNTRVISTIKESVFVTDAIMKSAQNQRVVISVDCEGINLGVKGQLTLIEVGTTRGEAFIFDVMVCPEIMADGGLKALLECDQVIKVIHDCRNDSVNLYTQFHTLLRNVFDTQSAHSVLQYQAHGKHVYKVKNISLNTLCELYNAPINPMKDQFKNIYRRDQKYWARRPLSKEMLLYAAGDVLVLINDRLYGTLAK